MSTIKTAHQSASRSCNSSIALPLSSAELTHIHKKKSYENRCQPALHASFGECSGLPDLVALKHIGTQCAFSHRLSPLPVRIEEVALQQTAV